MAATTMKDAFSKTGPALPAIVQFNTNRRCPTLKGVDRGLSPTDDVSGRLLSTNPSKTVELAPAAAAPILSTTPPWKGYLEYINDPGAERIIDSKAALVKQGVQQTILCKLLGKATQVMDFATGNGNVQA